MNVPENLMTEYKSIFRMHDLFNHIFLYFALLIATVIPCSALELLEADHGNNFTISQGEELTIILPGNPTTGYVWEVLANDSTLLKQKRQAVFVADADRIGAGGQTSFLFVPCRIGSTRLKLAYRRPWERETPPIQVFEVSLTVKQD
jgi:inhibitor of cysteine peptidase